MKYLTKRTIEYVAEGWDVNIKIRYSKTKNAFYGYIWIEREGDAMKIDETGFHVEIEDVLKEWEEWEI